MIVKYPEAIICLFGGERFHAAIEEDIALRRGFSLIGSDIEDQISEITIPNIYYIFW